jgi:hypothetical protein
MVLISGLERLLGFEHLPFYGRYGSIGMIKFLTVEIALACRLSIDVPVFSVCGYLFSGWRIAMVGGYGKGYFFPTWVVV